MRVGWWSRIKALLAAGLVGGGVLTLGLGVTTAVYSAGTDGGSVFLGYLVLIPVWLIVAVPTYLIGLTVIGLPA